MQERDLRASVTAMKSKDEVRLCKFEDVPAYLQFNQYILHGYRPPNLTAMQCLKSLLYIHNETFNILTHGESKRLSIQRLTCVHHSLFTRNLWTPHAYAMEGHQTHLPCIHSRRWISEFLGRLFPVSCLHEPQERRTIVHQPPSMGRDRHLDYSSHRSCNYDIHVSSLVRLLDKMALHRNLCCTVSWFTSGLSGRSICFVKDTWIRITIHAPNAGHGSSTHVSQTWTRQCEYYQVCRI